MLNIDPNYIKYYKKSERSEVFIGLTGALGTDLNIVSAELKKILSDFDYKVLTVDNFDSHETSKKTSIKISRDIINELEDEISLKFSGSEKEFPRRFKLKEAFYKRNKNSYSKNKNERHEDGMESRFDCSERQMDWGDIARNQSKENAILAYMAIEKISKIRGRNHSIKKCAYIIQGLKRPEEVTVLREVYGRAFYLIGVYSEHNKRHSYLVSKGMSSEEACIQLERDENETVNKGYGQNSAKTFELSDFFINQDWGSASVNNTLKRFIDLIFGNPYLTPTFDEYAMFSAYAVSLMTSDLARQVGAVIATKNDEIIATGCAEVPKYGGGNYYTDHHKGCYCEHPMGRDIQHGRNPNKQRISELVDEILEYFQEKASDDIPSWINKEFLENSPLKSLIEFMRSSHAESEAILSCARNGISTRGCTLYCTTMPCHECGKRIIGAGIERVVFIEPYPKSKTLSQHPESTNLGFDVIEGKVRFEPFVGVGPRKFIDLFSMNIGSGYPTVRQDNKGIPYRFEPCKAVLRSPLYSISYLEIEKKIVQTLKTAEEEGIDNCINIQLG